MFSSVSTKIRILIVGILALVSTLGMAQKLGDMLISPTRLTFDEKNRGGSIVVVNTSHDWVYGRAGRDDRQLSQRHHSSTAARAIDRLAKVRLSRLRRRHTLFRTLKREAGSAATICLSSHGQRVTTRSTNT